MADTVSTTPWVRPAARWNLPCVSRDAILPIQCSLDLQRLAAAVLVRRGFTDVATAREFLHPSLDSLHDPFLMRGMENAAARLFRAVKEREPILIYGDYDVDGTSSIVVLKRADRDARRTS